MRVSVSIFDKDMMTRTDSTDSDRLFETAKFAIGERHRL